MVLVMVISRLEAEFSRLALGHTQGRTYKSVSARRGDVFEYIICIAWWTFALMARFGGFDTH